MTLFPSRIQWYKLDSNHICFSSFAFPPRMIKISCVAAGSSPFAQTIWSFMIKLCSSSQDYYVCENTTSHPDLFGIPDIWNEQNQCWQGKPDVPRNCQTQFCLPFSSNTDHTLHTKYISNCLGRMLRIIQFLAVKCGGDISKSNLKMQIKCNFE